MKTKKIIVRGKGYNLAGTLITPDKPSIGFPAVIFYHGMVSTSKDRYLRRAQSLAKAGIMSLVFGFRGCWDSEGEIGKITIAEWLNDAILAFDFLYKNSLVDQNRIGISGKSFGGYIGALVSEKRIVKSMVFQAPAVYEDREFNQYYLPDPDVREKRQVYRNSDSALDNKAIEAMKKYKNALLIIGGELDDICPRRSVQEFYNVSPSRNKKIVWIKGADHPLTNEKHNQEYTKLMVNWFKKTL